MKKLILPIALLFFGLSVQAQKNYIRPYVGYGIGVPGNQAFEFETDDNGFTDRSVILDLSGGLRAGAAFGFFFSENLGLELNLNYQNNLGQNLENTSSFMDFDGTIITSSTSATFNSFSVNFAPLVHLQIQKSSLKPFLSVGPNIMLAGMSVNENITDNFGESEEETQFNPSVSLGFLGNAGVEIALADNLNLSLALQYQMAFYSPNSSEVVSYKINGENELSSLTTEEKETIYESEISQSFDDPNNPDEPTTSLKTRLDFSSVNLVVGLVILL
jgi:opacity protein-like surface antigen